MMDTLWSSRDLALVILLAVASFAYTALVGQLAWLFTGIPGSNLIFTIGHAILISLALLIYQGKRWRFFLQHILFAILIIPTYLQGTPFEVLPRLGIVMHGIQADILFNTLYGFFNERNKLVCLSVFIAVEFFLAAPFINILWFSLIYPPVFVTVFISTILLLLPVIIVESLIGGLIGYKIYQRVKKVGLIKDKQIQKR
ncbi:hypothetical protein E2P65_06530 [Candidatus Bathyarchaeota archaeon]|nr:hypothetical protein E2P65_06530 [Candidatus Bathyarchaeota archaeon]